MTRPYPWEFRVDAVRVPQSRTDGMSFEQIAAAFGLVQTMLPECPSQPLSMMGSSPRRPNNRVSKTVNYEKTCGYWNKKA